MFQVSALFQHSVTTLCQKLVYDISSREYYDVRSNQCDQIGLFLKI